MHIPQRSMSEKERRRKYKVLNLLVESLHDESYARYMSYTYVVQALQDRCHDGLHHLLVCYTVERYRVQSILIFHYFHTTTHNLHSVSVKKQ